MLQRNSMRQPNFIHDSSLDLLHHLPGLYPASLHCITSSLTPAPLKHTRSWPTPLVFLLHAPHAPIHPCSCPPTHTSALLQHATTPGIQHHSSFKCVQVIVWQPESQGLWKNIITSNYLINKEPPARLAMNDGQLCGQNNEFPRSCSMDAYLSWHAMPVIAEITVGPLNHLISPLCCSRGCHPVILRLCPARDRVHWQLPKLRIGKVGIFCRHLAAAV
jgi:hypothetical protein